MRRLPGADFSAIVVAHLEVTGVLRDYVTTQQIMELLKGLGQEGRQGDVKKLLISLGGENCGKSKIKGEERRGSRGVKGVKLKSS